ncbi:hypothetical protein FEF65_02715 [Mariprofundus erugo]|uniref:Uncharacterized protein n=1 Tax=Mariprofundus erugo TaxID=2528639 RepID=A0A5R9GUF5_9PROT|nr:hypothetical protein [Mariprofundus erugo]TLS68635.1 hypothetical protein FEF65_02715 [Mariprofundus erugo]
MTTKNTELAFNLWAVFDMSGGYVYCLSGKAYVLSGTDQQKLGLLKELAATDYLTAKRYRIPERFHVITPGGVKKGFADVREVFDPNAMMFEELFEEIERNLPSVISFDYGGQATHKPQKIPGDPLCVTTILCEDTLGNIRPILSQADMDWLSRQL